MLIKHFKNVLYTIVVIASFYANAGSFEDFFIALRNDNASAVGALLDRGFDPNTRDAKGQPGLTIAMQERALKAASALLSRPATEVNALNQAGESALMMSALKGDLAGAQLLLDHGAKVNQSGWAPLHYAATGPDPRLVLLLLERGAEVDAASPNGSTPLMMAAQYGSEDSVKLLLDRGADPRRRNQLDQGVIDFARRAGRDALVKHLETLTR
jgi:ankyrin repeat protein